MNEIIVAKSAGFCFGVERSVKMAEQLLAEKSNCKSFGPIIHNDTVVQYLQSKGLQIALCTGDINGQDTIIIRAHGVSKQLIDEISERCETVVDATCPKVKAIHKIVSNASNDGRFVIVIGMKGHPEVEAICGWCAESVIAENAIELETILKCRPDICSKPVTLVVQTTQTAKNYEECCEIAKKMCTNLILSDTICNATSVRQAEAIDLAAKCDAMIVIGSKASANSCHLAKLCSDECKNVQFIEDASEIDMSRLAGIKQLGITAGASTPSWIIKEVRNKMNDEIKIEEKELSFDEMLEETLKTIYNGDKVTGVVVAITGTEISVDLGTKYSGIIPTEDFTDDGVKLEDAVKIGDTVEAIVVRVNDVEGTATLSKKRLDSVKIWETLESAVEDQTVLEGTVVEENKGGVVVNVKGIRVFVPASQTDLPRGAELNVLLKKNVKLQVTEVIKARKRVVGSIRRVSQAERRAANEAFWTEIEEGKKYHGTVKSLTSYGAFVDIGGVDGMVHVSELSWGRINKPSDVVAVGDEIDVYVISFDKDTHKISLGYKDPNGNPWAVFTSQYAVGDVANVKIVKLMDFGAFAEVVPGVDGLIHISQIANRRIAKPSDVLTVGEEVEAKITAIDEEKHKVSLSIRALGEPAPAEEEAEAEAAIEE